MEWSPQNFFAKKKIIPSYSIILYKSDCILPALLGLLNPYNVIQ